MKSSPYIRASNIELLRLVLMFSIVVLHLYGGPQMRENFNTPMVYNVELGITSLTIMSVNTFVFVSGYFGIKFKLKSLVSLLIQLLFYSTIIYCIILLLGNPFEFKGLIRAVFPVSSGLWWFMSSYIGLFFIAPLINSAVDNINKSEFVMILVGLLFLNSFACFIFNNASIGIAGSSTFNFIVVYSLARYIAKYNIKIKQPFLIFILCVFACFTINYILGSILNRSILFSYRYANPLLVLSAVSFFFVFKNYKLKHSRLINNLSKLALGVYLIHNHPYIMNKLHVLINNVTVLYIESPIVLFSIILLMSILVFVVCLSLDYFRMIVCIPLVNSICSKISSIRRLKN